MAKKKYGDLETVKISKEDYDVIYEHGYSECLLDCRDTLKNLVEEIEENDLDAIETLKGFVEGMIEAIGNGYSQ